MGMPIFLDSGAVVPTDFIKTLEFGGKKIVFKFPNIDTKGTKWADYLVK
jgi:hypothetical protein